MEIYPVLQGWLTKSPPEGKLHGRIFKAKWRRRYFVLYVIPRNTSAAAGPQGALVYFDSEQKKKRRGAIELSQCEEVQSSLHYLEFQYLFSVRSKDQGRDRTYFLAADTEHEMIRWVDCLCTVLGFKEDGDMIFPADINAVAMPSSMLASDFSSTGRSKLGPQPTKELVASMMPAIQAGTVGHLLQQQMVRDNNVLVNYPSPGVITTASGIMIPESLLPTPPEKLGSDARLRKMPLSAEMEQQVLETYNTPGVPFGSKTSHHRSNGKNHLDDEAPPPLPQPRGEGKKLNLSSSVNDVTSTYDSPSSMKNNENLSETYDSPPPMQQHNPLSVRASSDETYDAPPPQKTSKGKKNAKSSVDSVRASADETYDSPPKKDDKGKETQTKTKNSNRIASSDETYDTPPKSQKEITRASADETYDAPPKSNKNTIRASADETYDAPPKSNKNTVRGSADETYDAPPKSNKNTIRASADETYDTPPKSNKNTTIRASADETCDAPLKKDGVRGSIDQTYDAPPKKFVADSLRKSADETYDTPPLKKNDNQSSKVSSTSQDNFKAGNTSAVTLPEKKGKKPEDKSSKNAPKKDQNSTLENATNTADSAIANRTSVELPQASRGIFFTSKSHSFRKDLSKPPVLPKRFNEIKKDAGSDSSDDSDTSGKSMENLDKIGLGSEAQTVEETKTGTIKLLPTVAEADSSELSSASDKQKKKHKAAKVK